MGDKSILSEKAKTGDENLQAETFAKDILGFEEILDDEEGDEEQIIYEDQEEGGLPEEDEEEHQESQMKNLSLEESHPK